ncbi:hypothetical protein ABDD95_15630 [Mucilaginibacter sp. PAMB04274]|uniref:hypothetical protein n=1 Tax=Mucilaginibacter sp. PAMB04274 TaxID=3138568 RepID=UPI0031F64BD1
MAHNFRYSVPVNNQAIYVSKDGNDASTTPSNPNTPKKTIASAIAYAQAQLTNSAYKFSIIVGAGTYYNEGVNTGIRGNNGSEIVADGHVVFRAIGTTQFILSVATNSLASIRGITFENYGAINVRHPFIDCTFKNCSISLVATSGSTQSLTSCRLFDCSTVDLVQNPAINCDFVNVNSILNVSTFYNNYCNGTTNVTALASPVNFNYNNLMGSIKVGAAAFQTLVDHKISNTALNQNSINLPPKYNGASKYDLSLQYDSPHIGAGQGGANIGSGIYAIAYYASMHDCWKLAKGASYVGVELAGTDFILSGGATSGYVISAPVKVFSNPTVINKLSYVGFTLFDKDAAGGTALNNNVPDSYVTAKGDASGYSNPDRLSIGMRYTDNEFEPAGELEWVNGYLTSAGVFVDFEINQKPLIDNAGKGNGHPAFNTAVAYETAVVWVQFKVTLTNAYV